MVSTKIQNENNDFVSSLKPKIYQNEFILIEMTFISFTVKTSVFKKMIKIFFLMIDIFFKMIYIFKNLWNAIFDRNILFSKCNHHFSPKIFWFDLSR